MALIRPNPIIRILFYAGQQNPAANNIWFASFKSARFTTIKEAWQTAEAVIKRQFPNAEAICYGMWTDPATLVALPDSDLDANALMGGLIANGQVFPGYESAYRAFCANAGVIPNEYALSVCKPTHPGWFEGEEDPLEPRPAIFDQTEDRTLKIKGKVVPRITLVHELPRNESGLIVDPDAAMAAVRAMAGDNRFK